MIPALIAGGASLLGDLFGGIFGKKNNNATNRTNLKIAQMNNDFNAAEAQKARDFQLDMWNKTNDYNDPSAQRERLAAAGLNPALMLNGGSAGQASSSVSAPAASSAGNPTMQPYDWASVGGSISNSILSGFHYFNERENTNANISNLQGQRALAEAQALKALSEVDWSKMTDEARDYLKQTGKMRAQVGMAREQQELNNMEYQGLLLKAQSVHTFLSAEAQAITNKYLDDSQRSDLAMKSASAYAAYASGQASYQSVKKMIAEELESYARINGLRISTKIAEATSDKYIEALNSEYGLQSSYNSARNKYVGAEAANDYLQKSWNVKNSERDYHLKPWNTGSQVIGNGIGVVTQLRGRKPPVHYHNTYNKTYYPKH